MMTITLSLNKQFDSSNKEDPCPVERAYYKGEIRQLFKEYSEVNMKTDYLFGTGWKWVNYLIPMFIKKPLGEIIGWHNMIWAIK